MSPLKPLFDLSVIAQLFSEDFADGLIITPNQRLAAQVKAAFHDQQSRSGVLAWSIPKIYPIEDWVQRCWQELILLGDKRALALTPLTHAQELLIWEQIIRQDGESLLLKYQATAKSVMAAYRTLTLWQTTIDLAFQEHPDCASFSDWASSFKAYCQQHSYIDSTTIIAFLAEAFARKQLSSCSQILPLGFQQIPPLYATLLENTGAKLLEPSQRTMACERFAVVSDNTEQELRIAARWIKQQIQQRPAQRIALVVADLKQRRAQIERIFNAEFEPQYILPGTARYQAPYNISAGVALSSNPLIHTALALLQLQQQETLAEDWFNLMRSPFLFEQHVFQASLCQAELAIRKTGFPRLTASQLQKILETIKQPDDAITAWLNALSPLALSRPEAKAPLTHWLNTWTELLALFGWPGCRRLDSIEYQQLKRWQSALDEFLSISDICGELSQEKAIHLLTAFLSNIEFQAESTPSPIQILGLLEGGGLCFDAIWLLGVNDHAWPQPPSPNPFIPINLQRAVNMPHASAKRELAFTEALFNDYLHSTKTLIASYSMHDQDQTLLPSYLLKDFPSLDAAASLTEPYSHPYYQRIFQTKNLEKSTDTQASPLVNTDDSLRGGTQILKNQAACPFKAFAVHRLNASELELCSYHVSAQRRGIMLHRALELLWQRLQSLAGLNSTQPLELSQSINNAATSAVLSQARQRPDLFGQALIRLEIERLQNLIAQWLLVEKARSDFTVLETESAVIINIADTPLRVRIDRIDRLADGSLLLIDYKTGSCSTKGWQGERIDEPQLPLYCVSLETSHWGSEVSALAFAQINIDKQGFVGVAQQSGVAPGIYSLEKTRHWDMPVEWPELETQWRSGLEKLMRDFKAGCANVDPKSPSVCQYCHLSALCRINDSRSFGHLDA